MGKAGENTKDQGDIRVRNLPESLYLDFEHEAKRRGVSMGQLAKCIIRDYLDRPEVRKRAQTRRPRQW